MPGAGSNGSPFHDRPVELLRFATAGSVDDGKSTLIGRLLYETKQIFEDQLAAVELASKSRGDPYVDLALLTDGLRAEREQGITIDVAYRYFATPRRKFIIADTPGHIQYTRNMVTGASTADVAVVLVDARKGVLEQSRRHAFISSLLRIPHMVVCVNKMDLVDWDQDVFERIVEEFRSFAMKLDVVDLNFIPVSALHGDNVVEHSERMPWYEGTPLLYHLEHVHIASDRNLIDVRFPVQYVIRPRSDEHHDYRGYSGRIESGVCRPGDEVVVLPSEMKSRISRIDTYEGPVPEAFPPMAVTLHLEDHIDISRGDMIVRPANRPHTVRELDAMVCWLSETPMQPQGRYTIKHTTRRARAIAEELVHRVDVDTLHRDETATSLELNEIGRVRLRTSAPLFVDEYRRNRATGSFVLVDEVTNDTVAAGMVIESSSLTGPVSPNVVWHAGIDREARWRALGAGGGTVWFTGLPSSGKSTIAAAIERRLVADGRFAFLVDGDNLRHGLSGDLGFGHDARTENVRRAAHVAAMLAEAGAIAVVSLVSPYQADRDIARSIHDERGIPFYEIFVDTPLEECERRDPKGLYAKARRGELRGFTGIDDPYETPTSPDLRIYTPDVSTDAAVDSVLAVIPPRQDEELR